MCVCKDMLVYRWSGFIASFAQHADGGKYRPKLILKGNIHSLIFHTLLRNNERTREKQQTAGMERSTNCPNSTEIRVLPELHGEPTVADCGSAKREARRRKWFAHRGTTKKKVKVNLKLSLVEHRWWFLPCLITTEVNMRTENHTGFLLRLQLRQ